MAIHQPGFPYAKDTTEPKTEQVFSRTQKTFFAFLSTNRPVPPHRLFPMEKTLRQKPHRVPFAMLLFLVIIRTIPLSSYGRSVITFLHVTSPLS
jgi:hypothetical protein